MLSVKKLQVEFESGEMTEIRSFIISVIGTDKQKGICETVSITATGAFVDRFTQEAFSLKDAPIVDIGYKYLTIIHDKLRELAPDGMITVTIKLSDKLFGSDKALPEAVAALVKLGISAERARELVQSELS